MDSDDSNDSPDASLLGLLRQIFEVLETSSIAEERGTGVDSKFWAAYKKISGEFDESMLERCNGNMDILMLFAGLFSAVNTAFIIAMQPNPADTTNDLLVQFMQNAWNGSHPVAFSAPVTYSSSKIWMQVFAYTSLTFSLLSAFGAVLGKQWLGYYKTNRFDRARGRLGARCQHRHRMFEELGQRQFEYVLYSFPFLLQISLFLFILSLAAATWIQHRIISLFIIVPTACCVLLYVYILWVSVRSPDSPFQTPISLVIRYLLRLLHIGHSNLEDSTASAMSWILDTSTNPDVLSLALDLMVTMSNRSDQSQLVLSPPLTKKVVDMFTTCVDSTPSDQSNAVSFGRALIHISWKLDGATEMLNNLIPKWKHWSLWRNLYLPRALEHCNTSFCRMKEMVSAHPREKAENMRTALRMALGAGMDKFINPSKKGEYVELVWYGKFRLEPDLPDVDWLMDCANYFHAAQDFDAAGDALLLLSDLKNISQDSIVPFLNSSPRSSRLRHCALRAACRAADINSPCDLSFVNAVLTAISPPMPRGHNGADLLATAIGLLEFTIWPHNHPLIGSPLIDIQRLIFVVLSAPSLNNTAEFDRYCRALIHFMHQVTSLVIQHPVDCKRAAVHIAYRIRRDLAMITGTPSLSVPVPLQTEVLSKLSPALLTMVSSKFNSLDYYFYVRLIFTLASHPIWLPCLKEDGHIEKCIGIMTVFDNQPPSSFFYLAGIFFCIERAHRQQVPPLIKPSPRWDLTRMAWHVAGRQDGSDPDVLDDSDGMEILEALLATTKSHIPQDASNNDLEFLRKGLGGVILKLESRQPPPPKEIMGRMKDLKRYDPSQIISAVGTP